MSEITISFPDGNEKSYPSGTTPLDIAKSISEGLARNILAAKANGRSIDLDRPLENDTDLVLLKPADPDGLEVLRHSCAHILAQAVKRLYPDALPTIGPVIEHGFYYDFDNLDIREEDLPRIAEEMQKIIKEKYPTQRHDYASAEEAQQDFSGNPYKIEIIKEYAGEGLSRYDQGEFFDLCRGPHVPHTGWPETFALTKIAKAYWRGDSSNKQLTRIYGLCFPTRKELKQHLEMLEEAAKRDHRKLSTKLGLTMFHEYSPGAPFFLGKGTIIYNEMLKFLRAEYAKRGYTEVITPLLYDKQLWETSGHWEHYRDDMFLLDIEGRQFALKPMNCPSHCLIYKGDARSYRDLPLRIADFAPLHRNELSGTLTGLTRVRKFSQDDAHIFCTVEQLGSELTALLEFVKYIYQDIFRLEYRMELSTKPEKALGSDDIWEKAEAALADALKTNRIAYETSPGDGAFYGPKIDIHIKDAIGRSHQCATIQLDFNLPERFDLAYEGSDGHKHRPVMIHRAIFGSFERFFAMMLEHFEGKFPLWLSPEQARVLPIADRHNAYAATIVDRLRSEGLRANLDDRQMTTSKKVREAELDQVNYILVVGDREVESKTVNVRTRDNQILGEKSIEDVSGTLTRERDARS